MQSSRPLRIALAVAATFVAGGLLPAAADAVPAGSTAILSLPPGPFTDAVNGSTIGGGYVPREVRVVSADGRYVVFGSLADGMDPTPDDDAGGGIYVRDRVLNTTRLVSRASDGTVANGFHREPTISADGTTVAFSSTATNLDPSDTDANHDIYVHSLATGVTTLASPPDDVTGAAKGGDARQPSLSADGQYVAFATSTTGGSDGTGVRVYRRDLSRATYQLVSRFDGVAGRVAEGSQPSINADGTRVAFVSSTAVDDVADTNRAADVYRRDLTTGRTVLVSRAAQVGNDSSQQPSIDASGDVIAFVSWATNLSGGDTTDDTDAYVRNVRDGTTELVSAQNLGRAGARGSVSGVSVAGNGGYVAFGASESLVAGVPADSVMRIYRRGIGTTSTVLVSRGPGAAGPVADVSSAYPSSNASGDAVAFQSNATNLADDNDDDFSAVYVRQIAGNQTSLVSRPTGLDPFTGGLTSVSFGSAREAVSADGRYVAFDTASNAISSEDDDRYRNVFRVDLLTGERTLVSRATGVAGAPADGDSVVVGISADGNRVAFTSYAPNLSPDLPPSGGGFHVRDVAAGTTTLVSRAAGLGGAALDFVYGESMSADGRHVAFVTSTAIDPADRNGTADVYVRDLDSGAVTLASRGDGPAGTPGNGSSSNTSLNADGTRVAFDSASTNWETVPPGFTQVWVRDLAAARTLLVSRADGAGGAPAAGLSGAPSLSDDGNRVAFDSSARNLGSGGEDDDSDVFVRDVAAGRTLLASRADGPDGAAEDGVFGYSNFHAISGDGNRVMFVSNDPALVPGDDNGSADVFVRDLAAGRTLLVSRRDGPSGLPAPRGGSSGGLSYDGRCAAFSATGSGLVPGIALSGDSEQAYLRAIDADCPPVGGGGGGGGGDVLIPPTPSEPPVLAFSLTQRRFAVGRKATAVSAARRRASRRRARRRATTPVGTVFRYRVSAPATLTITIQRKAAGRKSGRRCVRPTRRLRRARPCTRLVTVRPSLTRTVAAGNGRIAFSGRIGRRALTPGGYVATAVARNNAGASTARKVAFEVVRRARARARARGRRGRR